MGKKNNARTIFSKQKKGKYLIISNLYHNTWTVHVISKKKINYEEIR